MQRAARPAGRDRERRDAARRYAEFSHGAGRGTANLVMLTLGTGVGGGVVVRRRALPRLDRARAHGDRRGRRAVPGRVLGARPRRGVLLRHAPPTSSRGRCSARTRRRTTSSSSSIRRSSEIGHHLGVAIGSLVNIFGAERVVIGGGFGVAAFDLLLPAARARGADARRSPPAGQHVEIERAQLGAEAGLIGAGLVALRGAVGAARGLRDADREPRRHHAARARRAARGGRRARRGHAAHARPARAARDPRAARSPTTSTTRRRASRSSCRGSQAGERMALVTDAGMPAHLRPGRAARARGARRRACR